VACSRPTGSTIAGAIAANGGGGGGGSLRRQARLRRPGRVGDTVAAAGGVGADPVSSAGGVGGAGASAAGGAAQLGDCAGGGGGGAGGRLRLRARSAALDAARVLSRPTASPRGPTVSSEPDTRPLRRAGAYEIVGFLGRGGVADVHLARDTTGHKVALKLVRPRAPDDSAPFIREGQERMIIEARAVAAIESSERRAVVRVGRLDGGGMFIAMEHLSGMTLREALDTNGWLAPRIVIRIAIAIARGIGAAHARGIVHPRSQAEQHHGRATAEDDYTIKIIDFGIAKFLDGSSALTRVGTIPGTPQYLAPELCRGDPFDHRADLYSLGVLLHHASVGGYPIEGTPERESSRSTSAAR